MQTVELRKKLTALLLKINEGERQIEILRQALCEQDLFEPYAAFKRLEHYSKGSLNISDILKFLSESKITHIEEFCAAFIQRYDLDGDCKLKYSEFLNAVLPANNPVLRAAATQRANYGVGQDKTLPYQVEYALTRVFDREISFYSSINPLKVSLSIVPGFSYVEAFALLDVGGVGLISLSSLKDYFRTEGVFPSEEDLKAILRRLDKDNDGFVKFDEFVEGIKPFDSKSPLKTIEAKSMTFSPVSPFKETKKDRPDSTQTFSANKIQSSPLDKQLLFTQSAHKFSSPLTSTSKYAQKIYSERARKIIEQTVSPKIENKASPIREFDKEVAPKQPETVSPKRQKRETSPYKRSFAYTELPKSYPLGSGTRVDKERRALEEEETRNEEFNKNLSGTKRTLSTQLGIYSSGKKTPERKGEKIGAKGIDAIAEKNYKAVIDTLKQFVFLDKEIESAKRELDLQMDFNLLDVFKTFDMSFKGTIKSQEIKDAMKIYGVYPDKEELYLIMRRFDKNGAEELSFSDFANIFRPRQHDLMTKRTPKSIDEKLNRTQVFSEETKKLIAKVLRLHLENERSSERLRQNLHKKASLDLREIFKRIDKTDDGFLTTGKLKRCLEENQIYIIDKELDLLMERLDTNGDGKVSYVEFLQEITPKCN